MTATEVKDNKAFDAACEKEGLAGSRNNMTPFLPFKDKVGAFVIGILGVGYEVKYKPKKGKNKGKIVEATYFPIEVVKTDMPGVGAGDKFTVSPTGLLNYQFGEGKPETVKLPAMVAIRYMGLDDEGRHQTEVRWPK